MQDIDDFSKYYALDSEGLNGAYNQVQQRRNTLLTTSGMTVDVTKMKRELKYVNRLREGKNFPETTFIDSNWWQNSDYREQRCEYRGNCREVC